MECDPLTPQMLELINTQQEALAAETAAEERDRQREWDQSRGEGPGVTPGTTASNGEKIVKLIDSQFVVKDSGARESFDSGMVRDTEEGKPDFTLIRKGPMFVRWAIHMTKGAVKYGRHNWTKANSSQEYERFVRSAARHFEQWMAGDRDEDHAAAVLFNINAAEYVLERAF